MPIFTTIAGGMWPAAFEFSTALGSAPALGLMSEPIDIGERPLSLFHADGGGSSLDPWSKSSLSLYQRSPLLQGIEDLWLATPEKLVGLLADLRADVEREQGELYSLTTLAAALRAGGRLGSKGQSYQRFAGARELYDASPLLQRIPAADLKSPKLLLAALAKLRPAIVEEQRRVRGVAPKRLPNYSLSTLVLALRAGGRLPKRGVRQFLSWALGRDMYDHSPILQGRVLPRDLKSPKRLLEKLSALRPRIVEEQSRRIGRPSKISTLYTLVIALAAGERLNQRVRVYISAAKAKDLYDRCPLLHDIPPHDFETPERLIERLIRLRPAIAESMGRNYSLSALMRAAGASGQIPGDAVPYEVLASGRELYNRSPLLQNFSAEGLSSAEVVQKLVDLRPLLTQEQKGEGRKKDGDYSLAFLICALVAGGKIGKESWHVCMRMASAHDLYDRSPLLQNLGGEDIKSPGKLVAKLVALRPAIVEEQRRVRRVDGGRLKTYALNTLIGALQMGGRLKESGLQRCYRLAGARDLYDSSPLLQGISEEDLSDPQRLVSALVMLRAAIAKEQQRESYALGTLTGALEAGGRLPQNRQIYSRLAAGRDLYDSSPTLRNIPEEALATDEMLMRYLVTFRDRIGSAHELALNSLVAALYAGGRIGTRQLHRLQMEVGGPLEYFLKRFEQIRPEVEKWMERQPVNRSKFTSLNDPTRGLSEIYITRILKWGEWFLTDPAVVVRSRYSEGEMAWMALSPTFFGRTEMVPTDLARRLEKWEELERAEILDIIEETVWRYAGGFREIDDYTERYLFYLERLLWFSTDPYDNRG